MPNSTQLIKTWRSIFSHWRATWVLFSYGTCVIQTDSRTEPRQYAIQLLQQWGKFQNKTDINAAQRVKPYEQLGWIVTSQHENIFTFIGKEEVAADTKERTMVIELIGRYRCAQDAAELRIIHLEQYSSG
ncbi:MAG: hypothetical protein CR991_02200 [Proteobacteria bacterium]|nr:MAG: hypothetical protein CR991_02200 [Pseudomonadota bacterium]